MRAAALKWWRGLTLDEKIAYVNQWNPEKQFALVDSSSCSIERIYVDLGIADKEKGEDIPNR